MTPKHREGGKLSYTQRQPLDVLRKVSFWARVTPQNAMTQDTMTPQHRIRVIPFSHEPRTLHPLSATWLPQL